MVNPGSEQKIKIKKCVNQKGPAKTDFVTNFNFAQTKPKAWNLNFNIYNAKNLNLYWQKNI